METISDLDKEHFSGVIGTKVMTGMGSKQNVKKRTRDS